MTDHNWPGLQFNPAKGDTFTVKSLAHDVKAVGDELEEAHRLLESIGKSHGVWEGHSAEAFRKKVGELPKLLKKGMDSMHACARALETYHDHLVRFQHKAHGLERDAVVARAHAEHAQAVYDHAKAKSPARPPGSGPTGAMQDEVQNPGEAKASQQATDRLDDIIDKAKDLQTTWEQKAGEAERLILKASENHPADPGVWDNLKDRAKSAWRDSKDALVDNTDLLNAISGACTVAALACAATGVGTPVALVLAGVGAAAGATTGDVMGHNRGNGTSWTKIGLDAAGTLPVAGGAMGFIKGGKGFAEGLKGGATLAERSGAMAEGFKESVTNPLTFKIANKGIGKFGTSVDPVKAQLPIKAYSTVSHSYHWAQDKFGGAPDKAASGAPKPVRIAPPPSGPFLHATR